MLKIAPDIYIDAYHAILNARQNTPLPLYFETDTHWNLWGGAVAFNALADALKKSHPELNFDSTYEFSDFVTNKKNGGDLSRFLKIENFTDDNKPELNRDEIVNLQVKSSDFITGKTLTSGRMAPIEAPRSLTLFSSSPTLNNYKVLWIRDSFGIAMSPYMMRAFGNVLQIHYGNIKPGDIKKIVKSYKPDFVFITVVERDYQSRFFLHTL